MRVEFVAGSCLVLRAFLEVLRFSPLPLKPTSPNSSSTTIEEKPG